MASSPYITVEPQPQTGRVSRKPTHPFYLEYRAYDIQPFMCAPVIPGETMKNLHLQARCVSDPVKSPLIGWWNEYYFFYVKLRDFHTRDAMTAMLLTNTAPASSAAVVPHYYAGAPGYNFVAQAVQRCVEEYFRDEEEVASVPVGALPPYRGLDGNILKAKIAKADFTQSLMLDTDVPVTDQDLPLGTGYTLPAHMSGFQAQYDAWVKMRDMEMTPLTFEDWLKLYGVSPPPEVAEEIHRPELLRYIREFTYPSNTINPATGAASSALSWSIAERADKDRYFAEPGFIVGLTVTRPKVYLKNQQATMTAFMNDAYSWLPAVLGPDPFTSLKKFDDLLVGGPLEGQPGDYWIDLKDLFLYGEQFVNIDPGGASARSVVTVPAAGTADADLPLNSEYASTEDIQAFFVGGAAAEFIRVDGRVDLNILSRIQESTP